MATKGRRLRGRTAGWALAIAFVAGISACLGAPAAGAQDGPYGPTTTLPGAGTRVLPTCITAPGPVAAGSAVSPTVHGVPPGEELDLLLDGELVAETTAGPAEQGATTTDATFRFTAPRAGSGPHQLVVVGSTFNATCTSPDGDPGLQVLDQVLVAETPGGGSGSGRLPFTGAALAALVALALALIGAGLALRQQVAGRGAPERSAQPPW